LSDPVRPCRRPRPGCAKRSETGTKLYETSAQRITEGLGALRVREATVGRIDRFLAVISANNGPVSAKRAKTVLTGVLGLAARHDAIKTNPVRDTARIKYGENEVAPSRSTSLRSPTFE
jgi:hypothetical protein